MYPWICGRCAREFTRANLSELTVHHRNHDHDFSPPDCSNWDATGEYGDMIAMGILDPTKVTHTALQNAASIAGLMITTEAMVAEAPKKEEAGGGGHGGGGMGGMGGMDF